MALWRSAGFRSVETDVGTILPGWEVYLGHAQAVHFADDFNS